MLQAVGLCMVLTSFYLAQRQRQVFERSVATIR